MAYLASTLVTRSWYLSGIVARKLQQPSGDQINDGLDLLNFLLSFKSADINLIPYWTKYDFSLISGQEAYFIPNLVAVETMTFFIDQIRYSMLQVSRDNYWGSGRAENIKSLPYNYHVERALDGSNIYVYFLPQDNYPAQILGKFALTNVSLNTDLSLIYDDFYIEYLRHALAEYMCNEYGVIFPIGAASKMRQIVSKLQMVAPPDLSMQKMSSLQKQTGLNYGDVNIGRGWRPPS